MKISVLVALLLLILTPRLWAAAAQAIQQQRKVQEAAVEQAMVQQAVAAQQAAIQQAAVQQAIIHQQMAAQQPIELQHHIAVQTQPRPSPTGEEYIVSINDVLKSLETSSKAWTLMIDRDPKVFIIAQYVDFFRKHRTFIQKPPEYYVDLIDGMAEQNPDMLKNPFRNILQLVAILEYDFDNGQDKDKMIINLLGREGYLQNKQRLGLP